MLGDVKDIIATHTKKNKAEHNSVRLPWFQSSPLERQKSAH